MSEYNADIRQDDNCAESFNGDDYDDIPDDINNSDDGEVNNQMLFAKEG
jgi:hypothetical protein